MLAQVGRLIARLSLIRITGTVDTSPSVVMPSRNQRLQMSQRKTSRWTCLCNVIAALCLSLAPEATSGQSTFAQPYSAALRSDPAVGNIQGIQRYGRPLRTDPDQGEGYSYHVYPVSASGGGMGYGGAGLQSGVIGPPASFDWTSGLRNLGPPDSATSSAAEGASADPEFGTQSAVVTRDGLSTTISQIYHQPLIQIKMRVVEVARTDGIALGSVLEYTSRENIDTSLTSGQTANSEGAQGFENFRSLSRLLLPNLATSATSGTGALINLTSEHINWLIQGLATELSADVITAPEVVTLNGQNVEFVSGDKLPFELGQNVIQGSNNNIQQVFYKHVGTMVSVTPRIVNWGLHGEGKGEASLQGSEIRNWPALIEIMLDKGLTHQPGKPKFDKKSGKLVALPTTDDIKLTLRKYRGDVVIPFSVQTQILLALNNYSTEWMDFLQMLQEEEVITEACCNRCLSWRPQDCTIDLAVVVRLSTGGLGALPDPDAPGKLVPTTTEANIRAVANVIQLQSGQGVVMAGLIGESEIEAASKVPILGDLPWVGAMFRSKVVSREKTEVLIFIEAEVLDQDPDLARHESAEDYLLGQPYVQRDVLDNPLEAAMHRIGFGTYLPPHSHDEQIYWENFHRNVRKVRTHLGDAIGP